MLQYMCNNVYAIILQYICNNVTVCVCVKILHQQYVNLYPALMIQINILLVD